MSDRGDDGLTWHQRAFLAHMASSGGNWEVSCQAVGRSPRTVRYWLATEPVFKTAFHEQFAASKEELREMLGAAGEKAVSVVQEALDASGEMSITIKCPHEDCPDGGVHDAKIDKTDWALRKWAADLVLKSQGVIVEKKEVNVGGSVSHVHMSIAERTALERWRTGYPIPAYLKERFDEMVRQGALPSPVKRDEGQNVIEGDYRPIEESDNEVPTPPVE